MTDPKTEYEPKNGTVEDDLRSRLLCVLEATSWDRPYDTRIDAIRGMCDLTTDGMTPVAVIEQVRLDDWAVDFRGEDVGPVFRCIEAYPDRASALGRARVADKPLLRRTVTTTVTATPYEEVDRG